MALDDRMTSPGEFAGRQRCVPLEPPWVGGAEA
jgi:hypothetical protein